jgi:L-aminopeptidase/D-esterase-like protein
LAARTKAGERESTTLVVAATDAMLTKSEAKRFAVMAQTGLARAIYPVHTPLDGDVVFAAATGRRPLGDPLPRLSQLGSLAANVVARAVARAVYEAKRLPFTSALPCWRDNFAPRF